MIFLTRRFLLIWLIALIVIGSTLGLFFFYQSASSHATAGLATTPGNTTGISSPIPTATDTPTPTPTNTPTPTPTVRVIPTAPPTPPPPPRSTGNLPHHFLTGYWQNFADGAVPLRLSDINGYYTLVAVASADADSNTPGAVTFTLNAGLSSALGGYTTAQFSSDIQTLHARGKKVIISVGGGHGTVDVSNATNAANFASSVYGLMQTYGFDGVDIDIESGLDAASMTSALRQLSAKAGSRLIITLAPQTVDMQSTGDAYFQLALNIKNILTLVNMQYYNSGTMYGCDQNVYSEGTEDFLTALACIQLQGGLSPSQVSLGVPGSPAAASGGYLDPSTVNQALGCLARLQTCGSFVPSTGWSVASVMVWSINVDAGHNYAFANTVGPYLNQLP